MDLCLILKHMHTILFVEMYTDTWFDLLDVTRIDREFWQQMSFYITSDAVSHANGVYAENQLQKQNN